MHILEGEGLLNDASGVTALQFAIVALVTGSFSVMGAGFQLLFEYWRRLDWLLDRLVKTADHSLY